MRNRYIICQESNQALPYEIESVDGVPQIVYKLPLLVPGENDKAGLDLDNMLDCILIGPSQYAEVVHAAFVKQLETMGLASPKERVAVSNIPLREEK